MSATTEKTTPTAESALRVEGLSKTFTVGGMLSRRKVRALDSVDLDIGTGEIVALVGESGSGKSTLARCVARLENPESGRIVVDGEDVLRTERRRASRAYRGRVQMVFQDPFGSLNPVHRIEYVVTRSVELHGSPEARRDPRARAAELLETVGLDASYLDRFPHELSGGQRQRVSIARALGAEPQLILADEPTSMLDVSVRIGILNLLGRLRDETGVSILYVTHDLASARYLADRTVVMYRGRAVEGGESLALLGDPVHPYTQLLLSAVPDPERSGSYDPVRRAEMRREVERWLGPEHAPRAVVRRTVDATSQHWVAEPVDGLA